MRGILTGLVLAPIAPPTWAPAYRKIAYENANELLNTKAVTDAIFAPAA